MILLAIFLGNPKRSVHETHFAKTIAWLLRSQALLAGVSAVVLGLFGGVPWALAALVGGAIGVLLTGVTGLRIALSSGREPQVMVAAFYRAMALKLILAVLLFAIIAKWFTAWFVPVVIGYAATLVAYWLAMWRLARAAGDNSE